MDTQKILDVVLNSVSPICELLIDRDNCNYVNKNPEGYKDVTGLCPFRNSGICKFNDGKKREMLHAINSIVTSSSTVNLSNNNNIGRIPNDVMNSIPISIPNNISKSTIDNVPNADNNVYQEVPIDQFIWVNDDEDTVHISDKLDNAVTGTDVLNEKPVNTTEIKVITNKKSAAEKRKEWYKTHVLNKRKRGNK